jgi:broad specificity phosphatase PhoE
MTARLILICHASTDATRKFAFPADEPLDARGEADAAALAGSVTRGDQCWTAPELRTRQTAEALGLAANVLPQLRDCDYGSWKGRSLNDIESQEPTAVATWLRDPSAAPHGGESIVDLMRRVATWLDGEQTHHRRLIVVTHAAIIRAAVIHAIDATLQSFWRIDVAPLSCTQLSAADNRWNLRSIERSSGRGLLTRQRYT